MSKKKQDDYLENVTFDELKIGQQAGLSRTLSKEDIDLFAIMSGDINPAHLDEVYANNTIFQGIIGHGMWPGALISTVLGTVLPGPGTIYLSQNLRFQKPVRIGDTVHVSVTVTEKREGKPIVTLDCECRNDLGEMLVSGTAVVLAPTEKIRKKRAELPEVHFKYHDRYRDLIDSCAALDPLRTAVVHPVKAHGIAAIAEAVEENLLDPVLIGPKSRICAAAEEAGVDISAYELIDTEHSHAAAAEAVRLAASGKVQAVMKGALHTDELLSALVASSGGLRTERRISHAYVMDIPTYHKPLIITDAAINIAPNLDVKADICRNAVALWRIMAGNHDLRPKLAVLSAVETVNARMQSTLDAAALCKMADRGQIENTVIDGPLALDAAISKQSAETKGIRSEVAGDADILVAPDIEAANMIAKQLTFLGNSDAAGLVLGARVPVILTSRSDNLRTRLMSCALAVRVADARKQGLVK
ncbi:MAG: bifunctional enoyl-CoA hydratase/phosphate acetyltransferase [Micavibrio sp.]|nr:MAG: bifunctional enoyl-CoA hydratase/phosphate acetyltransferase [Micavibrio sp.]